MALLCPGRKARGMGSRGSGDHVTWIEIVRNKLSGMIPPDLGNLTDLLTLRLVDNQLSGPVPPQLSNLDNLQNLDLGFNRLSGSIPPELGNLPNLSVLYLRSNQLSGSIPPELGNLAGLFVLSLWGNDLSGNIPSELSNLVNLQELFLNDNQLSGSIPSELGNLVNLVWLHLENNQLSGTIPPELGKMVNLESLRLENNQLSGSIPPELGNLVNLQHICLYDNQLSGSISPELGNLVDLVWLRLNDNQLSGAIPVELMNLTGLVPEFFDICDNYLFAYGGALKAFLDALQPGWEDCQVRLPDVQIMTVECDLSGPVQAGKPFAFDLSAAGPPGASPQYRFYYKTGYGTESWDANQWQLVQPWSSLNRVEYIFPAADNYYVIGHVEQAPGLTWEKGDPQGGFTMDCSGEVQISAMYNDIIMQAEAGEPFHVTVHAAVPPGVNLSYRFYYRAGYGLPAWDRNTWQVIKEWSPDNWAEYTFTAAGNYYVISHVVPEGEAWEKGGPQGGFTVAVKERP